MLLRKTNRGEMLLLGRKERWKDRRKERRENEGFNFPKGKRVPKQIMNRDSCLNQEYTKVMRVLSGIFT